MNKNELIAAMWDSELPPMAKLVFLAILDYRNAKTGECYPSMDSLAKKTRMCRNTVASCVKVLNDSGFLQIKKIRPLGTKFTVNSYTFSIQCSPDEQSVEQSVDQSIERSPDGHKPIKPIKPLKVYPQEFENFFERFPKGRKGSRENTYPAWKKALTKTTVKEIMDVLEAYITSDTVLNGFPRGAASWLNDDGWAKDYTRKGSPAKPAPRYSETKKNVVTL